MSHSFSIQHWAAFSPQLRTAKAWEEWAHRPFLPDGDTPPELPEIPARERRRLHLIGRMAVQVACWCGERPSATPVIFASRYGDNRLSLDLLGKLSHGEPMSPTGFSISVHNAIGALFSIAQADKSNYIALSAGARTPIAALVEALGLLQDGAPEVLLVMYEQTLAPDYQQFADGPSANYAWAWRITRPIGTEARIELSIKNAKIPPPAGLPTTIKLPPGLELMRFFLSHDTTLDDTSGPTHWEWKKHA